MIYRIKNIAKYTFNRMKCKGIKEEATIYNIWQCISSCITKNKGYPILSSWAFTIYDRSFIQTFIVFNTDGMTPRLISHKNTNTPLATTVIDEGILFRNITAICKTFKNAVIRRLIRMMFCIGTTVITTCCFNL